jgi:protein-S-isoprenylcysteine O-methyltransferase Ste14
MTAQVESTGNQLGKGRIVLKLLLGMAVMAALMFVAAGRLDWTMGWVYAATYTLTYLLITVLMPMAADLEKERTTMTEEAPLWDKIIATLGSLILPLGLMVVAGLDHRFGASSDVTLWLQLAALALTVASTVFASWAAATNSFYARYVHIQQDRGHTVVTGGPYRFVRHPGYVGAMAMSVGTALALGSLWALALAALMCVLLVIRTALEDRFLQENLAGYRAYAQRVRYRLLPGIW